MRNASFGVGIFLALLGSGEVLAQHEQALARALQQEEVEGRVEEALASYRAVAAASTAQEPGWLDAQLGVARCLRRLARWEEAAAVLQGLEGAANAGARASAVAQEQERLERARAEQDEERKKLREELKQMLAHRNSKAIQSLGSKAIPFLLEEARSKTALRSGALRELFGQSDPAAVVGVLELVRSGELPPVGAEHDCVIPGLRELAQDWDPVIRAFFESADAEVRLAAARALPSLRAPATDLVRRALADPEARVRRALLEVMTRAVPPWVDDALLAEIVVGLARDPQIDIREQWGKAIESFARRCPEAADAAYEILAADEVGSVRRLAYDRWLRSARPSTRRAILERALGDPQPGLRLEVAGIDPQLLIPEDAPIFLPYLRFPDRGLRSSAAQLLHAFEPAALTARAEHVELLFEALADSEDWVRYGAGKALLAVARPEDAPRLARLLTDPAGGLSTLALDTFLRIDAVAIFPAILELLPRLGDMRPPNLVPGVGTYTSTKRSRELLAWLLDRGHRRELDQVLERIAELPLDPSVVGLLEASLDAEQKRALWSRLASVEDRKRATAILWDLRTLGRGDAGFLSTCVRLLELDASALQGARLALLLCEGGSAEHFDLLLGCAETPEFRNLGADLIQAGRYFARHVDETRRPRLEAMLRSSGHLNGYARATEVLEGASFLYLLALAHSARADLNGMTEVFAAIGRSREPDGVQALLELLRASSDNDVLSLGGILARGSSGESPQMRMAPHVLALHRARPERFLEVARQILESSDSADYAAESAAALCALLPRGEGDALLLRCLDDARWVVRRAAVRAVAHVLLEGAIPRLKELLRDAAVAEEANQALLRFAAFGYPIR
jgi:HEAT repeat protein